MLTLSAFSTFLKMIPINHMDTKSFLLEERHTQGTTETATCNCIQDNFRPME